MPLNKCRLCGETTSRKNYFFSDSGKALQLKRIILRVCEIEVSERDELPKFCCRSCHDKLLRLNKNLEIFASTCKSTQKELERELKTSRLQHENVYLSVTIDLSFDKRFLALILSNSDVSIW